MEPIMKMYMVSLLNQLCIIGNSKRKQMFQKKKKKAERWNERNERHLTYDYYVLLKENY